ncbi:MAG: ATP-binding cassette domain-containing protein [Spirochaetia bacterium]|nr:ATP-binding cassette domain-containing protein [Spirochaetia bacterium]
MIKINSIQKYFPLEKNYFGKVIHRVYALEHVTIDFPARQVTGIVGESGSGKSTLARILCGVFKPDSGNFFYNEYDSLSMKAADWKKYRRNVQMVFQDPYSSLNPGMRIEDILEEPLIIHRETKTDRKSYPEKCREALTRVGLSIDSLSKYPHEFSGGQRQRIAIARALMLNPDVVIFDEAVSALDVSIQAQILNLVLDLQKELEMTILFIAHDLSAVSYVSDNIAVMYAGRIVEFNTTAEIFSAPKHPYTRLLLDSIPHLMVMDKDIRKYEKALNGDADYPDHPDNSGCPFYQRCPQRQSICLKEYPSKTFTSTVPLEQSTGFENKEHTFYYECFNPVSSIEKIDVPKTGEA